MNPAVVIPAPYTSMPSALHNAIVFFMFSVVFFIVYILLCVIGILGFLSLLRFLEIISLLGLWAQSYHFTTLCYCVNYIKKYHDIAAVVPYIYALKSETLLTNRLTQDVELLVTANDDYLAVLNLLDSLNTLNYDVVNTRCRVLNQYGYGQ